MNTVRIAAAAFWIAAVSGCGQDTKPDVGAYLGKWYFVDSSGGIAGHGDSNYGADEVELTFDHFNKLKDGAQVSSQAVTYDERDCINGQRLVAMSTTNGGEIYCLAVGDTELYASQDAYDGFGYHFSRVKP